jgi:hypothetical protein
MINSIGMHCKLFSPTGMRIPLSRICRHKVRQMCEEHFNNNVLNFSKSCENDRTGRFDLQEKP